MSEEWYSLAQVVLDKGLLNGLLFSMFSNLAGLCFVPPSLVNEESFWGYVTHSFSRQMLIQLCSTETGKCTRHRESLKNTKLSPITSQMLTHFHNPFTDRHTHARLFNGPLSGTTQVSRYQKVKPIWILLKQETVSGSSISWAICKSAPHSRQITTPAPHHSVFYRPDALPATQPTASKH